MSGLLLAIWLAVSAFTVRPGSPVSAVPAGLTARDVTFRSGDTTFHGTVWTSARARGRGPGVVLVGGSGPQPRDAHLQEAQAFARLGLVALVYDKRTAGYSLTHRDYGLLASDALAAVEVLRSRPDVDPARVGLWGESEGAWVVSLAAARTTDVAYVVLVGFSGVPAAQQTAWTYVNLLRHDGVSGSMLHALPVNGTRLLVGAGLFPEAEYDPLPAVRRLHQPVLALWAATDYNHPPDESSRLLHQALATSGNSHDTIHFFDHADPGLRLSSNGFTRLPGLTPGYPQFVAAWIDGLASGAAPASEPAPGQAIQSAHLPPLAWYEGLGSQGIVLGLLLAAFAGSLRAGAVARRRGGDGRSPAATGAAVAGLGAVIGFLLYFVGFMSTQAPGPILAGRSAIWIALHLLVAVALLGAALAVGGVLRSAGSRGPSRMRLGLLVAGAVLMVPWALYWGLLAP